eukprot:774439-Prorocentrum_minimum.AAC.1
MEAGKAESTNVMRRLSDAVATFAEEAEAESLVHKCVHHAKNASGKPFVLPGLALGALNLLVIKFVTADKAKAFLAKAADRCPPTPPCSRVEARACPCAPRETRAEKEEPAWKTETLRAQSVGRCSGSTRPARRNRSGPQKGVLRAFEAGSSRVRRLSGVRERFVGQLHSPPVGEGLVKGLNHVHVEPCCAVRGRKRAREADAEPT